MVTDGMIVNFISNMYNLRALKLIRYFIAKSFIAWMTEWFMGIPHN
jgi:hypothetical protein